MSKKIQETPRRHPGDTQGHQETPRDTRRHPGDTRRYPGDTQETPGDSQEKPRFFTHAWRNIAQRADAQSVSDVPIVSN